MKLLPAGGMVNSGSGDVVVMGMTLQPTVPEEGALALVSKGPSRGAPFETALAGFLPHRTAGKRFAIRRYRRRGPRDRVVLLDLGRPQVADLRLDLLEVLGRGDAALAELLRDLKSQTGLARGVSVGNGARVDLVVGRLLVDRRRIRAQVVDGAAESPRHGVRASQFFDDGGVVVDLALVRDLLGGLILNRVWAEVSAQEACTD